MTVEEQRLADAGDTRPWLRPLGATDLTVSAVCLGGAPLGNMPEKFGSEVSEEQAIELVRAAFHSPISFIDTSNGYSAGESERRIGLAVAAHGIPDGTTIATKVDALGRDYSGARVRQSIAESRSRLGIEFLPLVYLHDPEYHDFDELTASGGAVDTLVRLKEAGEIGKIGVAGGDVRVMSRYLELGVFDVLLTHSRATLVDRSADPLIDRARATGMGVVNAAIYGGGILAKPVAPKARYGYRPASPAVLHAVQSLQALCATFDVPLATAALQVSLRDPRIDSTVVGASSAARLNEIIAAAAQTLPADFWAQADALRPTPDNWLDSESYS
jgi:D-threo-aldose 1-dehydrogenase